MGATYGWVACSVAWRLRAAYKGAADRHGRGAGRMDADHGAGLRGLDLHGAPPSRAMKAESPYVELVREFLGLLMRRGGRGVPARAAGPDRGSRNNRGLPGGSPVPCCAVTERTFR